MPAYSIYTRQAAFTKATAIKTALAMSKFRLFQAVLSLSINTTKDQLVAAEADFTGYTAGGYTLTAWTGPVNAPISGAQITSPVVNPAVADPGEDPPVGNSIAGWWVEDATGNVRLAGVFDAPLAMNVLGDGFTWIYQLIEGGNALVVFPE